MLNKKLQTKDYGYRKKKINKNESKKIPLPTI